MTSIRLIVILFLGSSLLYVSTSCQQASRETEGDLQPLKALILTNSKLDTIQARALSILGGFTAGTSYGEIWIRDFNTFINGSLQVHPPETVRDNLLKFLKIQGEDGNIVDGLIDTANANVGYDYRYSKLLPGLAAHKNTVETDQESSLLQAFGKYIKATGDKDVLNMTIEDKSVIRRLEDALLYILTDRWSDKYGLVTGATTIDWGDVQPESGWGVAINDKTKWAIDIYDNAMYSMAIDAFLDFCPSDYSSAKDWKSVREQLKKSVRAYLWDEQGQKYIPHLYLDGSPFAEDFDENKILYSGGSICAILAGFNTREEVAEINRQLVAAAHAQNHATIGFTVSPPYPDETFPNMAAYKYQNGGDWTWFGGRMIGGLIHYGLYHEAYEELIPMVDRVLANNGFYEWYDVRTGAPKGSGEFRGEAGVLYDAINAVRDWARK